MEPEISHRCQTCGAAFRKGERSCPQCDAEVIMSGTDAPLKGTAALAGSSIVSDSERPTQGSIAPTQPFKPEMRDLPFVVDQPVENQEESAEESVSSEPAAKNIEATSEGRSKRQRVKNAARDLVEDNVKPRVEKLRHASSVVLEEASAIDPSLRFVLIALLLFIVFIVLLALSFVR